MTWTTVVYVHEGGDIEFRCTLTPIRNRQLRTVERNLSQLLKDVEQFKLQVKLTTEEVRHFENAVSFNYMKYQVPTTTNKIIIT